MALPRFKRYDEKRFSLGKRTRCATKLTASGRTACNRVTVDFISVLKKSLRYWESCRALPLIYDIGRPYLGLNTLGCGEKKKKKKKKRKEEIERSTFPLVFRCTRRYYPVELRRTKRSR